MSKKKPNKTVSITESSTAQYLNFVAAVVNTLHNIEIVQQIASSKVLPVNIFGLVVIVLARLA
jgi:hypothetical protein